MTVCSPSILFVALQLNRLVYKLEAERGGGTLEKYWKNAKNCSSRVLSPHNGSLLTIMSHQHD